MKLFQENKTYSVFIAKDIFTGMYQQQQKLSAMHGILRLTTRLSFSSSFLILWSQKALGMYGQEPCVPLLLLLPHLLFFILIFHVSYMTA